MDTVLRAFSATVDDVNTTERSMVAKINSARLDRYRTVIDPRGGDFRNYSKTPVVLWCHGKDIKNRGDLPVGRNLWIRADKGSEPKVIAKTRFHKDEFSQQLYEAYRDGDITGWSISMLPIDFGPPSERELRDRPELNECEIMYRTWEMAEYSCVPCPGNPDCITIEEARSLGKLVSRGLAIPEDYRQAVERMSKDDACEDEAKEEIGDEADGDEDDSSSRQRFIKHEGDKWCVYSEKGKKLGEYDSEEEAKKRLGEIEYFKHKDGRSVAELPDVVVATEPEKSAETRDVEDVVEEVSEQVQEPAIELPPLVGRTFQQVFDALRGEEIEHRRVVLNTIQENIDWLHGKV